MEIGTCSACHAVNVPGTLLCETCGAALVTIAVNQTTSKIPDAALRAATASAAASAAANSPIAAPIESAAMGVAFVTSDSAQDDGDQAEHTAPTVADPTVASVADLTAPATAMGMGAMSGTTAEAATALTDAPDSPASAIEPSTFALAAAPLVEAYLIAEDGYRVAIPAGDVIVVGREDARLGTRPDVDLNPAGGSAAGVSRRHCRLLRGAAAPAGSTATGPFSWQVEDLRSTNYTTLNGRVLQAHVPVPLRNGDNLRLGKLRLQFHTT